MMKSAHLRNFNNPSRIGQLYLSGFWRILVQSEMASAIVIIGEIGSKSFSKRFFVDNDDVIEAFPSNRSNQALNIGALPGGSGCRKHLMDPHVLQLPLNLDAIDTVSIPDNVLRGAVIGKSLNKLRSQIQRSRSPNRSLGRWVERFKTMICCRKARISVWSARLDRKLARRAEKNKIRILCMNREAISLIL